MQVLIFILILAGSLLLTLFSYLTRLYSERGRFLIRGSRHNVEFFEEQVEPNLRVQMEQAESRQVVDAPEEVLFGQTEWQAGFFSKTKYSGKLVTKVIRIFHSPSE